MAQLHTTRPSPGYGGYSGYGYGWLERHSRQKQEASANAARSQESLPRRPVGTPRQVVVISLQSRSPSPVSHRVSRFSTTMTTPVQVGREVRTAPSTPSQTYRGVSGIVAAPKSHLGTPRSGATLRTSRKPVVLPAWPSLAAWTTYQPGTSAGTPEQRTLGTVSTLVKRQVSTASAVERQISTASAPVTEQFSKAGTLLSHGRSLSSSGRFNSTLAWSPRSVASSFHLSPRVQKFVLKPCSSFPSAPTPRVPPVVHIDLTSAQTPAASQVKATPCSGRELRARDARDARAISPREAKIEAEPRSKAIGSDDSDEDSDEVKELSSDSWAMARHREDGRMPSAERQLCRLPGTVVL